MKRGEILARLDTSRLEPQVEEAEATAAAQRDVVARMHHGSRPQEIAEARANVESVAADAANARRQYQRLKTLAANAVVSQQELDNAKTALDVAEAKLAVIKKALDLAVAGPHCQNQPRQEDIAQAEAELRADEAQAAFLRAQLADTTLVAPSEAVVRTRLMELGEMGPCPGPSGRGERSSGWKRLPRPTVRGDGHLEACKRGCWAIQPLSMPCQKVAGCDS